MRCIPGSEREVPGEEKLSSLARFDALMREMDEKRRQREAEEARQRPQATAAPSTATQGSELKSAFDDDDSDSDSERDSDEDEDEEDEEEEEEDMVGEADVDDRFTSSTTPAQRALDFIAGRRGPTQRHQLPLRDIRTPPSYNHDAFMALTSSGASQLRPQTGYSKNRSRPSMTQRTHSQPQLATILASFPTPADGSGAFPSWDPGEGSGTFSFTPGSPSALHRSSTEKRQSASSAKRLSFTEFTRRLSSTSSLLLMQTNASGAASSRASHSDQDLQPPPQSSAQHLHHLHPRAGLQTPLQQQQAAQSTPPVSERERCGWRGSVGVFGGGEGGFL
jgi:hypothetical protein